LGKHPEQGSLQPKQINHMDHDSKLAFEIAQDLFMRDPVPVLYSVSH
jgi:hypothetical protein